MLVGAFASAAAATFTGSVWLGLSAGVAATIAVSLVHGYASIDQRANQIVSGTAINMVADGLTALDRQRHLVAGRPHAGIARLRPVPRDRAAVRRSDRRPFRSSARSISISSPVTTSSPISPFSIVPLTYWALYSTRFGLRLRAVGENPAAVDTAGISVRGVALQRGRHLRRAGGARRRLSGAVRRRPISSRI